MSGCIRRCIKFLQEGLGNWCIVWHGANRSTEADGTFLVVVSSFTSFCMSGDVARMGRGVMPGIRVLRIMEYNCCAWLESSIGILNENCGALDGDIVEEGVGAITF